LDKITVTDSNLTTGKIKWVYTFQHPAEVHRAAKWAGNLQEQLVHYLFVLNNNAPVNKPKKQKSAETPRSLLFGIRGET